MNNLTKSGKGAWIWMTFGVLILLTAVSSAERRSDANCTNSPEITAVYSTGTELIWPKVGRHEGAELTIMGSQGQVYSTSLNLDAVPEYGLLDNNEKLLDDGEYVWQIRLKRGREEFSERQVPGDRFLISRGRLEIRDGWPTVEQGRECLGHVSAAVDVTGTSPFSALYDVSGNWTVAGKLGVGTDLPTSPVDIRTTDGTARIFVEDSSGTAAVRTQFQLRNNGAPRFALKNTGSNVEWSFQQSGPGSFLISKEGTGGPEMQVYQNGRVRMGPGGAINFDLTPTGNLTIAGSLTANGSTFPDYVFEPGYTLMPLPDLADFIQQERRLPDIPSAEEVKKQGGHNMTEMQLKLLEKIEELTLYTVQQDRQLRQKNDRIEALELRLAAIEEILSSGRSLTSR